MYKNVKQGWYTLKHPEKYLHPIDEYMQSTFKDKVMYKSSLELKFLKYCDLNKYIVRFSVEPFPIEYIKPTDGQPHRYYIDFVLEFANGNKFLVEIKPYSQTKHPKLPTIKTYKSLLNYKNECMTYLINQAKWKAAKEFAAKNGFIFTIITDLDLN